MVLHDKETAYEEQVRAGEAEQDAESARGMLNDERRARVNERREKDIMAKELSSLRSREQHLCAALGDRRERTATVPLRSIYLSTAYQCCIENLNCRDC